MVFNHLDLTLALKSSRPRRDIIPESPHTVLNQDIACWSDFNPLCLAERVKNGLHGVQQPPEPSLGSHQGGHESPPTLFQLEETFSHIGSNCSESDARIYLTQTPSDAGPSTVVWASPEPTWGQWSCLSFSYCISVMTEHDAKAVYAMDSSGSESESEVLFDPESPLPPVYECTQDGVMHLWLIVPNRPSVDGMMQLSEEQMRAAVKFYDLSSLSNGSSAATTTIATKNKATVDPYDCKLKDDDGAGGHHYYADAPGTGAGAVLLSCSDGNEVDTVALAVLLLTRHHSRTHTRNAARGLRAHAPSAEAGHCVGSELYTTYRASRLIDDDPRVSHVWKGLLEWQDVERVQEALLSCVY